MPGNFLAAAVALLLVLAARGADDAASSVADSKSRPYDVRTVSAASRLRLFSVYDSRRTTGNPIRQRRTPEGLRIEIPEAGKTRLNEWGIAASEELRAPSALRIEGRTLKGKARLRLRCYNPVLREWRETSALPLPADGRGITFPLSGFGAKFTASLQFRELELFCDEPDTELLLERSEQVRPCTPAQAVEPEFWTGSNLMLLTPEREGEFAVLLKNRSSAPVELEGRFRFHDFFGRELVFERAVRLGAGEEERWKPVPRFPARGIWVMEYRLRDAKGNVAAGGHSFGVLEPSGTALPENPEFSFGVCNHWINPDVVEAMRFCGIRAVRCTTPWFDLQPRKGEWDFSVIDSNLACLEGSGIALRCTLAYTPPWATREPGASSWRESRNRLPSPEAWREYVAVMAKRYGGRNQYYEVWNEPDLRGFAAFSVEEYVELLKIAYETVKAVDPSLKVASGGFATIRPEHEGGKTRRFQEDVLRLGGGYFDLHSYHEHGTFDRYPELIDRVFLPMRKQYGITRPWIASETAMHSANGNEVLQAETLFRKLLFAWSRGAVGYTWYNLINSGGNPADAEHNYGMMTRDLEPKYVFGVYAMLTRIYREARYVRQLSAPGDPFLFLFRTPGGLLLTGWNRSGKETDALFMIASDAAGAELVDMMGNPHPVVHADGRTLLPVGRFGSTLRLRGATRAEAGGEFAVFELPDLLLPGRAGRGMLRLTNPWPAERVFRFRSERCAGLPGEVTLGPEETRRIPFTLAAGSASGNELPLEVDISAPGWNQALQVRGSVPLARVIPAGGFGGRPPDFRLDRYGDLVTPWENDPATAHLVWRDPSDLSALVWLEDGGAEFRLHVEVRDDVHAPSPTLRRLWDGDSVQFALAFPKFEGYFELGAAEHGATPHVGVWNVPAGFDTETVRRAVKAAVSRKGTETVYDFAVPKAVFGDDFSRGFRFNLIVNDNDGDRRKGWLQVAPGLGSGQTAVRFPTLFFQSGEKR